MNSIGFLKNEGHKLLDEYISLGDNFDKKERNAAYQKLEKKIQKNYHAHFKMMTTEAECLHAIERLNAMITKRRQKIKLTNTGRIKFAPNLQKIQKELVFTKVESYPQFNEKMTCKG